MVAGGERGGVVLQSRCDAVVIDKGRHDRGGSNSGVAPGCAVLGAIGKHRGELSRRRWPMAVEPADVLGRFTRGRKQLFTNRYYRCVTVINPPTFSELVCWWASGARVAGEVVGAAAMFVGLRGRIVVPRRFDGATRACVGKVVGQASQHNAAQLDASRYHELSLC